MSTLEYVFWHVLGYTAMPVILLVGFVGVSVAALSVLSITVDKQGKNDKGTDGAE